MIATLQANNILFGLLFYLSYIAQHKFGGGTKRRNGCQFLLVLSVIFLFIVKKKRKKKKIRKKYINKEKKKIGIMPCTFFCTLYCEFVLFFFWASLWYFIYRRKFGHIVGVWLMRVCEWE